VKVCTPFARPETAREPLTQSVAGAESREQTTVVAPVAVKAKVPVVAEVFAAGRAARLFQSRVTVRLPSATTCQM
jgi:hypothetical protein